MGSGRPPIRRRVKVFAALLFVVLIIIGDLVASTRHTHTPPRLPASRTVSLDGSFVSLLRICLPGPPVDRYLLGCMHGHDVERLELFSLSHRRRIGSIATVPSAFPTTVLTPAATNHGSLLLTYTRPSHCPARDKGDMECDSQPNSCSNTVTTLSENHTTPEPVFTVSGALAIGSVVPSPDGSQAAYSAQPCTSTHPPTGVYIRDLKSGRTRTVFTTNFCSSIGRPAWNAAGTEIIFRFQHSTVTPRLSGPIGSGPECNPQHTLGFDLAILNASDSSAGEPPRILTPAPSCNFDAAAFDRAGIVAAEGCAVHHKPAFYNGVTRGPAYIAQYNATGQLQWRIMLPHPGLDPAQTLLAPEPRSARVLITQDQPNGLVKRDDDHVYELDGKRLRQVTQNSWGSGFLAVPW